MKRAVAISLTIFTCIACISLALARTKRKAPKYEVKGTIQTVHDYCGGAAPTEDQRNPKPYPSRNTTVYFRSMVNNRVIDSAVSDSAGNFTVQLLKGDYCIVEKWKTEPFVLPANTKYETYDSACYRKQYQQCDQTLSVKGKAEGVKITLQRHCAWTRPCVSYHGPMPPAAPPVNRSGNQPGHQE